LLLQQDLLYDNHSLSVYHQYPIYYHRISRKKEFGRSGIDKHRIINFRINIFPPFGIDLTDNKTLIAMIAWLLALWKSKNEKTGRWWVISAAIILLAMYSIPHSTLGSELNYETMQVQSGN